MDELIAQVSQRTGLPPEQARAAAQAVVEHLRGRLPAALSTHLDQVLSGGSAPTSSTGDTNQLGGMLNGLEGIFKR